MARIKTFGELESLLDDIKRGECSFVAYDLPFAMIAKGSELYEAPIGHLIPALMRVAAGQKPFEGGDALHEVEK